MKVNKVTQSEFARDTGLTRQAVSKALKEGLLPYIQEGGKKLIDLNNPDVKAYKKSQSRQREAAKKKEKKQPRKPGIKQTKKRVEPEKKTDNNKLSENDLHKQIKIAELEKKQMQVDILKKKYLPAGFVQDHVFRYIDKLNSNLERMASVYINEVGQKILAEEEVLPAHIDKFVSLVLQSIDDTKNSIIEEIDKYEPK